MKTTTLGRTGLAVSRIAFGTWQLGGDWGRFDEAAALAAIRPGRELGLNFFDTAQAYGFGASERLLGTALRNALTHHRDQLVIATKGGLRKTTHGVVRDASPGWLRAGVDASLRALGVEHIDLYQVHWPDPTIPAGTMTENTTFAVDDWRAGCPVFVGQGYLHNLAAELGITISQLAISCTLAHPGVHVAILGARHTRHVEDSLTAADITLSATDLTDIDTIMATALTTTAVTATGPTPESV